MTTNNLVQNNKRNPQYVPSLQWSDEFRDA
jgi:hypothetical protein